MRTATVPKLTAPRSLHFLLFLLVSSQLVSTFSSSLFYPSSCWCPLLLSKLSKLISGMKQKAHHHPATRTHPTRSLTRSPTAGSLYTATIHLEATELMHSYWTYKQQREANFANVAAQHKDQQQELSSASVNTNSGIVNSCIHSQSIRLRRDKKDLLRDVVLVLYSYEVVEQGAVDADLPSCQNRRHQIKVR